MSPYSVVPKVMHCGGEMDDAVSRVYLTLHNDNNNSVGTRRKAFVRRERIHQMGVTALRNWWTAFAGRLPWGLGTFGIMCECRGVWMKNSRVILPCCFCQERLIFPFLLCLLPLFVILIICPSKLAFSHRLCFNTLSLLSPLSPPRFCVSHTHYLLLPLIFRLSQRAYLRLRIHKTRLRSVCFCYSLKMAYWEPHCKDLIRVQPLAVWRGLDTLVAT